MTENPYRTSESAPAIPAAEPAPTVEPPAAGPVKQKIEIVPVDPVTAEKTGVAAEAVVVKEKPGEVNIFDKAKGYYHTVVTVVGAILLLLNQLTPVAELVGGDVQKWISGIIIFITALLNFLKSNEQWVNKIPTSGGEPVPST